MGQAWERFVGKWGGNPAPEEVAGVMPAEVPCAPPVVQAQTPKAIIERAFENIDELSPSQRTDLEETRDSDGFEVLDILFERVLGGFTRDLLHTDPADKEAVASKHAVAHAAWLFRESIANQIEIEIKANHIEKMEDELINRIKGGDPAPDIEDQNVLGRVLDPTYVPPADDEVPARSNSRKARSSEWSNPVADLIR